MNEKSSQNQYAVTENGFNQSPIPNNNYTISLFAQWTIKRKEKKKIRKQELKNTRVEINFAVKEQSSNSTRKRGDETRASLNILPSNSINVIELALFKQLLKRSLRMYFFSFRVATRVTLRCNNNVKQRETNYLNAIPNRARPPTHAKGDRIFRNTDTRSRSQWN